MLPTDSKDQRTQKRKIINRIKADLEIELGNQSVGLISRQLKKASFIKHFESLANKKNPNTKSTWESVLKYSHNENYENRKNIGYEAFYDEKDKDFGFIFIKDKYVN